MKISEKIIDLNREWNFVMREINSFKKGGTEKRQLLFAFQIFLASLSKIKNQKVIKSLVATYRKHKKIYEKTKV